MCRWNDHLNHLVTGGCPLFVAEAPKNPGSLDNGVGSKIIKFPTRTAGNLKERFSFA